MLLYSLINEIWYFLNQISPYLILGFFVAGILSLYVDSDFIEKNLGKKEGLGAVIKASLLGIPLPLCSCSVIPVSASLKRHGASKGAISSFLLSTPQTGVDSIMVTYGLLGPIVAIVRPIIALLTGLLSGTLVHHFDKNYNNEKSEDCKEDCCSKNTSSSIKRILEYSFVTLPKDIAKPLVYGILIASIINIAIPSTMFSDYVGTGFLSMIFMIIIGIPLYVCATASIPIALAMMMKGATLGAAIVFLMVGPATNTTSITTMIKILGKKSTVITLSSLIIASLFFGVMLDNFDISDMISSKMISNHEHIGITNYIFSLFFIGILLNTFFPRYFVNPMHKKSLYTQISISGMSCQNCVDKIEKGIKSLGVEDVDINLSRSMITIKDKKIDLKLIHDKIISLGYEVD